MCVCVQKGLFGGGVRVVVEGRPVCFFVLCGVGCVYERESVCMY